jgi:hypothetical protein
MTRLITLSGKLAAILPRAQATLVFKACRKAKITTWKTMKKVLREFGKTRDARGWELAARELALFVPGLQKVGHVRLLEMFLAASK